MGLPQSTIFEVIGLPQAIDFYRILREIFGLIKEIIRRPLSNYP